MSKKLLGYVLGAVMAFAIALPVLPIVPVAHAIDADGDGIEDDVSGDGALGEDDFFGGTLTGNAFASSAGLSAGDLPTTIASIIRVVLGFLGIVAVVIILIGGFKWMTAGGNDDKVKSARKIMVSGIIGLVIVLSAFAIAQFVLSSIVTATA